MKKIILASSSPRRKELLSKLGIEFDVIESNIDEKSDVENSPYEWVKAISEKKAEAVSKKVNYPSVIIAADTIVTDLGKILGKPSDKADAVNMLKKLQGRKHTVYTGITIIFKDEKTEEEVSYVDATDVYMNRLSDEEIEAYASTDEPYDKAGAYAIQGKGALFIDTIYGDYYTVVGLPLSIVYRSLKEHGVNLMESWKKD